MEREKWTAVSSGVGIGRIWRIEDINLDLSKRTTNDIEGELKRFRDAVNVFNNTTEAIAEHLDNMHCMRKVDIVRIQALMVNDESLCPEIENRIRKGISAEFAVIVKLNNFNFHVLILPPQINNFNFIFMIRFSQERSFLI